MKKRFVVSFFVFTLAVAAMCCIFFSQSTYAKYSASSNATGTAHYTYQAEGCTGGTASCDHKAVCTICGNEYGDFNHTGVQVWRYIESGHWKVWDCCGAISQGVSEHVYDDGGVCECGRASHTHQKVFIPAKEATCEEDGNLAYYNCTCDKIWAEDGETETLLEVVIIPAIGHKWYIATCLAPKTCQQCGETEGVALEHQLETLAAVEPTCNSTGLTEGKRCTVCGTTTVPQQTVAALSHTLQTIPAVAATCTQEGAGEGSVCSVCGVIVVAPETVPALGHTKQVISAIPATCTESGLTAGERCTVCGVITKAQEVENALGHIETATPALSATCTQAGHSAGVRCSRAGCGAVLVEQETIDPIGHTEIAMPQVPASCIETGLSGGVQCSVCYEILEEQTVEPAVGHGNYVSFERVEPTCTETGLTAGVKCGRCGTMTTPQTVIPASGHTEVTDTGFSATCTKQGVSNGKHCTACGEITQAQTIIQALGHKETVLTGYDSTCTKTGLTNGKQCSVCNTVTVPQETIPVKGHTEVIDSAVAATCTTAGKTEGKHCSVCNTVLVAQQTIEAKGHSWKNATCTAPQTCNNCGATQGNALGHSWNGGSVTTAAGCTTTGVRTYTCNTCQTTKTESIAATGHSSVSGGTANVHTKCSACGTTLSSTHSYSYSTNSNSTHKKSCNCGYSVSSENCTAASGYKYDGNYHFQMCSLCKTQIANSVTAHSYDNVCDPTCNGQCGYTRNASHNIVQNQTTGVVYCTNGCGTTSSTPQTYYSSEALFNAPHDGFNHYARAVNEPGWGSYIHAQDSSPGTGAVIQLNKNISTESAMGQYAVIQYCHVVATNTNNGGKNFAIQVNNGGTLRAYYIPVMSSNTWGAQVLNLGGSVHNNHFYLALWNSDIFVSHIAFFTKQSDAEAYAKFLASYPIDGNATKAFMTISNNGITQW